MFKVNGTPILDDEITILNELKSQLAVNGIELFREFKKSGTNIQTNCPYHKGGQESKPSFGITTVDIHKDGNTIEAGTGHCFACGHTVSFPELISNCFGKDDMGVFGTQWLYKNFLTVQIENRPDLDLNLNRNSSNNDVSNEYVSEEELDSYRYYHPYMWKRKMTPEVVEIFDIGYDKESRCLTFPVRDINGNTLFVAKRSVITKFFNYPSGVEKPVYGLFELSQLPEFPKELIICESMINAITCWVYGKYAVALNGTGTPYQYKQLAKLPCRKYISGLDPDKAGIKGTERLKNALKNRIITSYNIPRGKDINDLTFEEFLNLEEFFF